MARRSMELFMAVNLGNGDEGIYKVIKFPIPIHVSQTKGADAKDEALIDHAEYTIKRIKSALERMAREDDRNGIMDSW